MRKPAVIRLNDNNQLEYWETSSYSWQVMNLPQINYAVLMLSHLPGEKLFQLSDALNRLK